MAHAPSPVAHPVTEDAFTADRQKFFGGFCTATVASTIFMIVLLALMAIFLL